MLGNRPGHGSDPQTREVTLDGDEVIRARTVILATGVVWRRLVMEGFDKLIGKGIYYGAARSEAGATNGLDLHLVGQIRRKPNIAGRLGADVVAAHGERNLTAIDLRDIATGSVSRTPCDGL